MARQFTAGLFLVAGCAAAPPAHSPAEATADPHADERLKLDLARLRSPSSAPACEASVGEPDPGAQVWGKDDGRPGLEAARVRVFLCRHRREIENACWDRKFDGWDHSDIEFDLVVDPSGAVLRPSDDGNVGATASLERGGARVSSPELAQCVESVVDSWKFPEATMPTWMTLSFRFPR